MHLLSDHDTEFHQVTATGKIMGQNVVFCSYFRAFKYPVHPGTMG